MKNDRLIMQGGLALVFFFALVSIQASALEIDLYKGWQQFSVPAGYAGRGESPVEGGLPAACELVELDDSGSLASPHGGLAPGAGYWLHCDESVPFTPAMSGPPADGPFTIRLSPGWNLIGNPFSYNIDLRGSATAGGAPLARCDALRGARVFAYDRTTGGYYVTSVLAPWRGYFIYAAEVVELTLLPDEAAGDAPGDGDYIAAAFGPETPVETDAAGTNYVAGQLLAVVAEGADAAEVADALASAGWDVEGVNAPLGILQVEPPEGMALDAAAQWLAGLATAGGAPAVDGVARNYVLTPDMTPGDPLFTDPALAAYTWPWFSTELPLVWNEYTFAGSPVVAVVDTGVDASHPELASKLVAGRNFVDPAAAQDTGDGDGHGTQVAGIIAAEMGNGEGLAGVCPECRVMPVKVCAAGAGCPLMSVLNGLDYAVSLGAPVVALTMNAQFDAGGTEESLLRSVFRKARAAGVLIVTSAGNGDRDAAGLIPAGIPWAMTVAAHDGSAKSADSNYGAVVDIAAPGENIYTTDAGGGYAVVSGTSAAAAFVAGAAVTTGNGHTCARLTSGAVMCWGYNEYGQLGDGTTSGSSVPVEVSGIDSAVYVEAGDYHTCAVLESGAVMCWGRNYRGQLGNGTTTDAYYPVEVSGIDNAVSVSAGDGHTCVALENGEARCWGDNYKGKLGNGTTSYYKESLPVEVVDITHAVTVAAGKWHSCALLSSGKIMCWGAGGYGQLGHGTITDSSVPVFVEGIEDAVSVTAGTSQTCAELGDGSRKCWGNNWYGQLGDGTNNRALSPVDVVDPDPND